MFFAGGSEQSTIQGRVTHLRSPAGCGTPHTPVRAARAAGRLTGTRTGGTPWPSCRAASLLSFWKPSHRPTSSFRPTQMYKRDGLNADVPPPPNRMLAQACSPKLDLSLVMRKSSAFPISAVYVPSMCMLRHFRLCESRGSKSSPPSHRRRKYRDTPT